MSAYCSRCGTQNSTDAQFCIQCGGTLVPLQTPFQSLPTASTRYGGFWIRFIAAVVDGILIQVIVLPVSFIIGIFIGIAGVAAHSTGPGLQLTSAALGGMVGALGAWLYSAMMESSTRQATLGKMIFGMKVTDLEGRRLTFGRATARHFAKYLSALILFIGYIMAGFTEKKQALHDMIVGTLVRLP